jgi:hypothetical protein
MIIVILAAGVIALLAAVGAVGTNRPRHDDETERFHRAAQLTSDWARSGVTRPVMLDEATPAGSRDPAQESVTT